MHTLQRRLSVLLDDETAHLRETGALEKDWRRQARDISDGLGALCDAALPRIFGEWVMNEITEHQRVVLTTD